MKMRWMFLVCGFVFVGALSWGLTADDKTATKTSLKDDAVTPSKMVLPEYDKDGALLRPVDFEKWPVVGTSVGLGYDDNAKTDPKNPGTFHNVYLQPEAFDHFVETGEFPEQTIFIVTNLPSRSTAKDKEKHSVLRSGFFADTTVGLEVSVKDSKRFEDGWAYFMYHDKAGEKPAKKRDAEQPIGRKICYDCHAEHGAVDHVFTQYYSVLTAAREKHLARQK